MLQTLTVQTWLHQAVEGATRCILMALDEAKQHGVDAIDYVNTHGTSTPAGDVLN